jgi:transposase-like protein
MICPMCSSEEVVYASYSGGREMYCPDCDDNFPIPDDESNPPRAKLLQTWEGRAALRAKMDQELARRRDEEL